MYGGMSPDHGVGGLTPDAVEVPLRSGARVGGVRRDGVDLDYIVFRHLLGSLFLSCDPHLNAMTFL